jgi:hypothetical protein
MLAGLGLAGLAGCSAKPSLLADDMRLMTFSEVKDAVVTTVVPEKSKPEQVAAAVLAEPVKITPAASHSNAVVPAKDPAQCEYFREDTFAQTDIMRSPTLRGSYNSSGKASLSMGMSISQFGKANTLEDSAEVRCRLYKAETGLRKLVFLSPQGLTASGFRAKYKTIDAQSGQLRSLKGQAMAAMQRGEIDHEKASGIVANIDKILADASVAKSQADRRTSDLLGLNDNASILGRELLRAEADLQDLNSRLRTYDATDLSVSTGWNDDLNTSGLNTRNNFSAKVNFSVKLGALLPSRFDHEERAKQARLRAVGEEEGGMLWQVNTLRLAHERAIQGLVTSQAQLDAALAESRKLLRQLESVPNPEFSGARIGVKVQIVAYEADKAAVAGSLTEIRQNMARLKLKG